MNWLKNIFSKTNKQKVVIKEMEDVLAKFNIEDDVVKSVETTFSICGSKVILNQDFSEKAENIREEKRKKSQETAWTLESGEYVTWAECELIGDYFTAKKRYSKNEQYCVAYVREVIDGKSTGIGKIWLIDCFMKDLLFTIDTTIISDVFITNCGTVVFNKYSRNIGSHDSLCVYDKSGKELLKINKKCTIQIDEVSDDGYIKGHYLDKKYTEFEFIV